MMYIDSKKVHKFELKWKRKVYASVHLTLDLIHKTQISFMLITIQGLAHTQTLFVVKGQYQRVPLLIKSGQIEVDRM